MLLRTFSVPCVLKHGLKMTTVHRVRCICHVGLVVQLLLILQDQFRQMGYVQVIIQSSISAHRSVNGHVTR